MRFILPFDAFSTLNSLRADYQQEKNTDVAQKPSWLKRPIALGGTDYASRHAQLQFIEKIQLILKPHLLSFTNLGDTGLLPHQLTIIRVYLAVLLYVLASIKSSVLKTHSALSRLISTGLGIDHNNYFDSEDKELCFLTAKRVFFSSPRFLDELNHALIKSKAPTFSEHEWAAFHSFLCTKTQSCTASNYATNYPITTLMQLLCGSAFAYTGATIGFLSGDVLSRAAPTAPIRQKLTLYIGGTLLVLGTTGPAGIALFAPFVAEQLITTFCSISLAHLLSIAFNIIGQGIGFSIGMPLDVSYALLGKACSLIAEYCHQPKESVSGIRIVDGNSYFKGLKVELVDEQSLPVSYSIDHVIELKDHQLYVNGTWLDIQATECSTQSELSCDTPVATTLASLPWAPHRC